MQSNQSLSQATLYNVREELNCLIKKNDVESTKTEKRKGKEGKELYLGA